MKAHIEPDWPTAGFNLYLFHEGHDHRVPFLLEDGSFVYDDSNVAGIGDSLPVTLFIPREFYEAIRAAMIGEALDNDDALRDARMVRDRLLTLIEKDHNRMEQQAQTMFDMLLKGAR